VVDDFGEDLDSISAKVGLARLGHNRYIY